MEAYRADKRMLRMAEMLDVQADTVAGLPTHYLLNISIPDYSPQWRRPAEGFDGPGVMVLVHARMTPATRQALASGVSAPGASPGSLSSVVGDVTDQALSVINLSRATIASPQCLSAFGASRM